MSEDNPQDVQTAGTPDPKEPGEIGWPANFSAPGDPSLPGVATAAPTIVEGVLVAADGSPLTIVDPPVASAPVAEPEPEPEPEEVVESEYAPDPEVSAPTPTDKKRKHR